MRNDYINELIGIINIPDIKVITGSRRSEKSINGKNNYLLIDEVQLCNNFEKAINSIHSKEIFDIYVT